MNKDFSPDYSSAPGETIAELLEERDLSQADLSERLGVSAKHVNQVVKGTATLSPEFALGLEKVFGTPANFWLTRESHHRAWLARQQEQIDFEGAIEWAKLFPVSDLKKRGFVAADAKGTQLVSALLSFFGIASPDQWSNPEAAFRKSQVFESDPYALSAWLRIGQLEASRIECAPFDANRFRNVLEEARTLTRLDPREWEPKLVSRCAEAGVALVVADTLPKVRANGAARWVSSTKAALQLSIRYRWEDIFWFSFFHEAAHILLHRKKAVFIEPKKKSEVKNMDEDSRELEDEADAFAAHTLIPPSYDRQIRDMTISEVPEFARSLGIAPAIVIGRMQHDHVIKHSEGNHLRRRFVFAEEST